MIRSVIGRRTILALILTGAVLSFSVLYWVGRGGAISYAAASPAIKKLLEHFIPLLAILSGFYFSERTSNDEGNQTSVETFAFALVVVAIWVLGPPILIAFCNTIEAAMRLLDSFSIIGTSLTSACLSFYFAQSSKGIRTSA